jgi:peptide/nickel transport system permease protein
MKMHFKNLNFGCGLLLTAVVVLTAAVSLVWTPYDADKMDPGHRLQPPSFYHLLGTDQYGRDMMSRVMVGAVNSIVVGLATVVIGMTMGVVLGLVAAYFGKWADESIMRFSDLLFGFPAVLTAILISAVWGPSIGNVMIAIGIFYIPVFARLTRAVALTIWGREFIDAARASGAGEWAITIRHVLPNLMSPLIIQATIQFAVAVLAEAGLSYLGLGTQPPHASWGRMLYEAQTFMEISPWMSVFPGIAIDWTVLGFNLLGDGIRDNLDPHML